MSIGILINHTISFLTSPIAVSLALGIVGLVLIMLSRRTRNQIHKMGLTCFMISIINLWFFSSGLAYRWLGMGLEHDYPPVRVEELPKADAIVVLGGGVGANTNTTYYTELYMGADRVAHAARIWKAGKAPIIIPSGSGELQASRPFLKELGVPESAILVENTSGNTEENARFVSSFLKSRPSALQPHHQNATNSNTTVHITPSLKSPCSPCSTRPKILLVTSAWHMRRALLLFRRYAPDLEIIPAACDYEATIGSDDFSFWSSLLPNADALLRNSYMLKEYIGYYGYKYLRR